MNQKLTHSPTHRKGKTEARQIPALTTNPNNIRDKGVRGKWQFTDPNVETINERFLKTTHVQVENVPEHSAALVLTSCGARKHREAPVFTVVHVFFSDTHIDRS